MTNLKNIFEYIIYYIVGNIIFNLVFSLTELIFYRTLGAILDIYKIFITNMKNTIIIYTILYILILIGNIIYNKKLINKLNILLKKEATKNEK